MEELNDDVSTAGAWLAALGAFMSTLAGVGLVFKRFGLRIVSVDMLDQRLNRIEDKVDVLSEDFREDVKKYGVAIAEMRAEQRHLKERTDEHHRVLFERDEI